VQDGRWLRIAKAYGFVLTAPGFSHKPTQPKVTPLEMPYMCGNGEKSTSSNEVMGEVAYTHNHNVIQCSNVDHDPPGSLGLPFPIGFPTPKTTWPETLHRGAHGN